MTPCKKVSVLVQILFLMATGGFPAVAADDGFMKVTGPCGLSFPADHGPHPDYRTEWWYYTGNLTGRDGHRFGFQLTFFRRGIQPPADRKGWPDPSSAWRTDQIYLAHAAISDITGGRHPQADRMARPVLSMAGAELADGDVTIHLHGWQATITPQGHRLQADAGDFALALDLTALKPPVPHGEGGYSRKGQSPDRASCYYSFTRLHATGSLTVAGTRHTVQGTAWMDHEFSTAPLQPGIVGWDWFSLQLADHSEVMLFLLRQPDGTLNPASSGTVVLPGGDTRHLTLGDVRVTPLSFWTSPHSGARYPVGWRLRVLPLQLDFTLTASLKDQEMRTPHSTGVVYWEGSVQARGTGHEKTIDGVGYVELTGYAAPFDAPM
ncbi:lipocalin-like domain-containing protein [Desulfosarcina alkanivorans]|uniref:lipocalin-like domain-containing protein n=1 Tax=Desulfosarcina alkanivorans TaxID=571177 RepID=UPI0012D36265|nr:lipocalin-like domain-containing protein [Desulfosarcina alkanivorans]